MNVELVAQMFKNYQSNILFHLEGMIPASASGITTNNSISNGQPKASVVEQGGGRGEAGRWSGLALDGLMFPC